MNGKYYWLKLKKDFFKRHDIRIIEAMPNGKDYILFYLKLLVESVDHEGELRFSDTIPYNAEMLSVITNTNIDIVKGALEIFTNLKMIDVLDDSTIYMNEVSKMIGSAADNDNAIRQKRFRDNQKAVSQALLDSGVTKNNGSVTKNNADVTECVTEDNESKSIEIDIEKDIEIDSKEKSIKEKPAKRFIPPTVEEVRAYCQERDNGVDPEKFVAHYTSNGWKVGKNPMKNWRAAVITWERKDKAEGNTAYQYRKPEGNIGMFSHLRDKE